MSRRTALAALGALGATAASADPLAVGAAAPDFELPGSKGEKVKLSAYRGKKNVVLAFYPKAFTGG
jgi:peroxiredoxin